MIKSKERKGNELYCIDPTDFLLEKRIRQACQTLDVRCELLRNPGFLNSAEENQEYRNGKKRWFMADFYKWQRQRLDLLMDGDQPEGGQWSYDEENRKKVPKKLLDQIPEVLSIQQDDFDLEAKAYVQQRFSKNFGLTSRQNQSAVFPDVASICEAVAEALPGQSLPTIRRL